MKTVLRWITAAGLGLLAHSAARAEPVTLDVFYTQPGFAKFHEPIAQAFMKAHPDIKVQFRAPAADYDEGHLAMLRQAVTNQLPDVYYAGYHLLAELVQTLKKRDQVVDLGPLLKAEPADWVKANYSDAILALGRVDGELDGIAFNASSPLMYYNEQLVKKAGGDPAKMPGNFAEVIALAKKIHGLGGDVAGVAYNVHEWPDDWLWRSLVQQGGSNMVGPDGKAAFGGPAGLKALEHLRAFVTEGGMPLINFDQSREQFIAGKIGLFFDTPARLKQVTELIGDRFTLKTAVFPIDDRQNGKLPTGGNAVIMMKKNPTKQKAAWEYIKFVTGPEAQKIVVETTGYLPINLRATGPDFLGPFYDKNPNFKTIVAQMDRSAPWQGYPGGNSVRIWRTQRETINGVMRGEMPVQAGLDKLVSETNAMIK